MDNRIYKDIFGEWADVQREFSCEYEKIDATMSFDEPSFIFAVYSYECYSGDTFVIFSNDGKKFFIVQGGHCSCYGLEGQWEPEEMPVDAIRHMLRVGEPYGLSEQECEEALEWINNI